MPEPVDDCIPENRKNDSRADSDAGTYDKRKQRDFRKQMSREQECLPGQYGYRRNDDVKSSEQAVLQSDGSTQRCEDQPLRECEQDDAHLGSVLCS